MSAAAVIDLESVRARKQKQAQQQQQQPAPQQHPPVWVPMLVWVPLFR